MYRIPNQNFCETEDDLDIHIPNCNVTNKYHNCQSSQNKCKFSYASWCPVCDNNSREHRRRCKSECVEATTQLDAQFRKRVREMKTLSPKKRDLSENSKYLELREKIDNSRIRSNLCELPTTYINNCQSNVPSKMADGAYSIKYSNYTTDHFEHRSNSARTVDNSTHSTMNGIKHADILKKNGYSSYMQAHHLDNSKTVSRESPKSITIANLKNNHEQLNKGSADKNHRKLPNLSFAIQHTANSKHSSSNNKNKVPYDPEVVKNNSDTTLNILIQDEPSNKLPSSLRPNTAQAGCNSPVKLRSTRNATQKTTLELPKSAVSDNPTNNKTEIKRNRVRPRSDSENLNEISYEKQADTNSTQTKKARDISPAENKKEILTKNTVRLTAVKSRNKISAIKLRKVRSKIAHSVSSDSNYSDTDSEETDSEQKSDSLESEEIVDKSENINGSSPSNKCVAGGDIKSEDWPMRSSLFAHIPPYILFSSHEGPEIKLPQEAARLLKWRLSTITPIVVRKTLLNTGFKLTRSEYSKGRETNEWSGCWGKHIKSLCFQTLKEYHKLNHFPGTFQIGRKDRLWKNLQRLMFKYGQKEFGFIPRTFVLPHDLKLLRQSWEKTGLERWIIKPPASARGSGIKVIHRWTHLPKKKSLVVQQYISNPYLINGSKFDLRLYVLVTSFNPLRIYLYPEGLVRFASTKYSDDLNTLCDRYMHLTNYSINKLSSQYTANEDANSCKGHKWTLTKLWEYLEMSGVNTKGLWRSLSQLVIKTMLCAESSISQLFKANINSRYNCYELFGVDILLDERLKPWLLEVNISPSLHSASPLDLHVKGPLVQSLLNLAQFHFPPKFNRIPNTPACLNPDLYTVHLTTKERLKQTQFLEIEDRQEYISDILNDLTGDDVRHLTQAEDELTVIGTFERIFPTSQTHNYFQFMEPRYHNRLFDAWENRYEKNRKAGIKLLQLLCEHKLHLEVAPKPVVKKLPIEIEQTLSAETSTSEDSIQSSCSKKSQSSIASNTLDPTIV